MNVYFILLFIIYLIWKWNLNFWSKIMLKYFTFVLNYMIISAIMIDISIYTEIFLVKYIRTYLNFSNWVSCYYFHYSTFLRNHSNYFAFIIIIIFYALYNISSMKSNSNCVLLNISRRLLLYRIYNIDENDNSCEIPVEMEMKLMMISLNHIWIILLFRKNYIHFMISTGILLLCILYMNHSW